MKRVVNGLTEAIQYAANEIQEQMLINYIKHFVTGENTFHKLSQECWVKDKKHAFETMVCYIETHADPISTTGEFEWIVSIVNKERSEAY